MVEIPPRRRKRRREERHVVDGMGKGLIDRCGFYCASCLIYAVSHEPRLAERRRRAAVRWKCAEEAVACEGCQALTPAWWGSDCNVLKCLEGRDSTYCDECAEIAACGVFGDVNGRYGGMPRRNLARRREVGDEGWLAEQFAERGCRRCGRPAIYGDENCAYCGAAV